MKAVQRAASVDELLRSVDGHQRPRQRTGSSRPAIDRHVRRGSAVHRPHARSTQRLYRSIVTLGSFIRMRRLARGHARRRPRGQSFGGAAGVSRAAVGASAFRCTRASPPPSCGVKKLGADGSAIEWRASDGSLGQRTRSARGTRQTCAGPAAPPHWAVTSTCWRHEAIPLARGSQPPRSDACHWRTDSVNALEGGAGQRRRALSRRSCPAERMATVAAVSNQCTRSAGAMRTLAEQDRCSCAVHPWGQWASQRLRAAVTSPLQRRPHRMCNYSCKYLHRSYLLSIQSCTHACQVVR